MHCARLHTASTPASAASVTDPPGAAHRTRRTRPSCSSLSSPGDRSLLQLILPSSIQLRLRHAQIPPAPRLLLSGTSRHICHRPPGQCPPSFPRRDPDIVHRLVVAHLFAGVAHPAAHRARAVRCRPRHPQSDLDRWPDCRCPTPFAFALPHKSGRTARRWELKMANRAETSVPCTAVPGPIAIEHVR